MNPAVVRTVTVVIPDWPAVALQHSSDDPLVVLERGRVIAASAVALQQGVRHGDRRRSATRSCPSARVVPRDVLAEVRAFEPVIAALADISPRLEIDQPGIVRFDMRGPTRRLGGEQGVVDAVAAALATCCSDQTARIGVADGPTVSLLAARLAVQAPLVIPVGGSAEFLARRPIGDVATVNVLTSEGVDLLVRLGIVTIGDLAALDPRDVLVRFGAEGARAHHIATGIDDRPLAAIEPASLPERERRFDDPLTTVTPAVFAIREMSGELVEALSSAGLSCTSLVLSAETEHSEWTEQHWYRAEGFNASAIVDRARWQLDAWAAGSAVSAGIVLVRLRVVGVRPDVGRQDGFWGGITAADEAATRAVARLVAICGEEQVRVPVASGGRLPGERCIWVPVNTVDLADASRDELAPVWPGSVARPAPTSVPISPEPVEVLGADGSLLSVSGRGDLNADPDVVAIGGRRRRVVAWAGPWPLLDRWWDRRGRRRLARLQVVLDDGSAHLLAVEQRRWSLMGTHD